MSWVIRLMRSVHDMLRDGIAERNKYAPKLDVKRRR